MRCPTSRYRRGSSQPKKGSSRQSSQTKSTLFRRFPAIVANVAGAGGPYIATVAITASLADCNYIYSSSFLERAGRQGRAARPKTATVATIGLKPAENQGFHRRSALRRAATVATIAAIAGGRLPPAQGRSVRGATASLSTPAPPPDAGCGQPPPGPTMPYRSAASRLVPAAKKCGH
jgi:hypothetical protein